MSTDNTQPKRVLSARFELRTLIGRGAFGAVYRAHDRATNGDVAVKLMTADAAQDDELVARFERERRINGLLDHKNIAAFIHAAEDDGVPYIVFELVRGVPLDRLIALRKQLGPAESAHVMAQVLDALDSAHRVGIIHRDLKPVTSWSLRRWRTAANPRPTARSIDA